MECREIRGREFTTFVVRYAAGVFAQPPWKSAPFDCFIIDFGTRGDLVEMVSGDVARSAADWVETFGFHAEAYHDAVDRASVEIGRQESVGCGFPMTAWYEKLKAVDAITDYVGTGGQGSQAIKVVLIVGNESCASRMATAIRQSISTQRHD